MLEIATTVDVAIEGFRPGVADRLGVGPDGLRVVNPSIIYCSISGYGQDGPLVPRPGTTSTTRRGQAFSPPARPRSTRAVCPWAISPAAPMPHRDLARQSPDASADRRRHDDRREHGRRPLELGRTRDWRRVGVERRSPGAAFPGYGTFSCADGNVTLGVVSEDPFWIALCTTLGLHDVASLDLAGRAQDGDALRARLRHTFATRTRDEPGGGVGGRGCARGSRTHRPRSHGRGSLRRPTGCARRHRRPARTAPEFQPTQSVARRQAKRLVAIQLAEPLGTRLLEQRFDLARLRVAAPAPYGRALRRRADTRARARKPAPSGGSIPSTIIT